MVRSAEELGEVRVRWGLRGPVMRENELRGRVVESEVHLSMSAWDGRQ